ncbi:FxDxF family PEP-CTERM protein [Sphingomonas nostoxanthinifaciens]|uniref:FxDxF family PEP-CTERM protein n=1 Tax=Sphingomonas nostoxanthinifaciens TaxID=2872652 RepID=UPI001CC1FEA2|nr:FxDxF family PEP-CTERM protein [Sphingomonas nostoxanthinifaciens]UAK24139.1 FxDxF family PEP-CTERM protein [Sphingomonas nostoxanthinifaciens]
MNATTFVKSFAVASVVALASPAFSTVIVMTPTTTGSTGGFTATHTTGTDFTDDYTFSVGATPGTVGASSIELVVSSDYLALSTLVLNGTSLAFSYDATTKLYSAFATTASIADPQSLSIAGSVVNGGGSYGGNVTFTTAAVPEVATWGMMLVGFGAMGAALRSNRRRAGAFA